MNKQYIYNIGYNMYSTDDYMYSTEYYMYGVIILWCDLHTVQTVSYCAYIYICSCTESYTVFTNIRMVRTCPQIVEKL